LIEDNATNLDLMNYLLCALCYDVTCATDGITGLELARAGNYDLVLTDILMPELDGYELARQFKADPRLKGTPLVAVTALAMAGDRDRIIAAGFNGYISKPIDPQKFAAQITSFLKTHEVGNRFSY
jgi:two-component system cell cycle response regulator